MNKLDNVISKRRANAKYYFDNLNQKYIKLPIEKKHEFNTYHLFVIEIDNRDQLRQYLKENNIITGVHYPVPIHLQQAALKLGYKKGDFPMVERQSERILSLPVHQYLTKTDLKNIVNKICEFFI